MSRETTFGEDLHDRSVLEATLRYLSERVGAKLRQNGKLARCVTLKLRFTDFATITRNRTLAQVTDVDDVIFESALKLLRTALVKEKRAVRLIGVGVTGFSEPGQQFSLLEDSNLRLDAPSGSRNFSRRTSAAIVCTRPASRVRNSLRLAFSWC
jgi:DNA polymerase-4